MTENSYFSTETRGGYSWKSDSLVLPKRLEFYGRPAKNHCEFGQKVPKPNEVAVPAKNRFWLSMPKKHYNNILFDHTDCFEFVLGFLLLILSCLPLL